MQHIHKQLIIFGCGYLGKHVAEKALAEGISVYGVTRNAKIAEALEAKGVSMIVTEIEDLKSWQDALDPHAAYVLNCLSAGRDQSYQEVYIKKQNLILDWLGKVNAPNSTYIYTSSTGVYTQDQAQWVNESAAVGGSGKADILVAAESLLKQRLTHHRRWFIMRLGGIYGPCRHHMLDSLRLNPHQLPAPVCHKTLNLIYVKDAASAIVHAFKAQLTLTDQIYNVVDDAPSDRASILAWLRSQLNLPSEPVQTKDPVCSVPSTDRTKTNRKISNQKAKAQLGWQPVYSSFKKGYSAILKGNDQASM